MRQLHRGKAGFAGELDRLLGGVRRIAEMPEPLLEVGLQVMEISPIHAPRRREPAFHRLQQIARGRVVALADERGGHRVVDFEQVGGEPVTLGDLARLGDHRRRLIVAAIDVVPERKMRAPPHLHQRRDLGRAQDRLDPRDEAVGRVALGRPVEIVEQRRGGHHPRVEVALAVSISSSRRRALTASSGSSGRRNRSTMTCAARARNSLSRSISRGALPVEQAFELRQPAIERREVRPFVVVPGDDRVEGERLPAQIASGAKGLVGTLERRAAPRRPHEDPCATVPVFEPRIGFPHRLRQRLDPVRERLRPSLARPVERVGDDDPAHRLDVVRVAEERQRVARLPARFRSMAARAVAPRRSSLDKRAFASSSRNSRNEPVVVVSRRRAAAAVDEEVPPIEIIEKLRGLVGPRERHRLLRRERRRYRRQHQHALVLGSRAIEDLAGEILEDRVLAFADRLVERRPGAAHVLAQEHERRHPAIALPRDPRDGLAVELCIAAEHRFRFVGRARERCGLDPRDTPARDEPRELLRRVAAGDRDDGDAVRHLLERMREGAAQVRCRCGPPGSCRER